jgi:large subunit ribosomal protein L10
MLTRAQKQEQVAELRDKLGRATSVILADYRGLDVASVNALRKKLRGAGEYDYRVIKNSVLRRASEGNDLARLRDHLAGPTAIAIAYGDPVGLARLLVDYAKDHERFELKAGVLEGQTLDRAAIARLATLPTLGELRGRLVGLLQAPATQLARLLAEPGAQLARLVEARRARLGEQPGA